MDGTQLSIEKSTALLLQRSLASLAREVTRRRNEALWRPEGEARWFEEQVKYIRMWVAG